VADHVEPHVQHALADPIGQRGKVDPRPDVAAPPARLQEREHRGVHRGGRALRPLDQLLVRAGRRLVEGELQRGAVAHGAVRDLGRELDDPLRGRRRQRLVEPLAGDVADVIEIGVVAPDQLDQDRFLGLEVVIEAARQDPCGVGDLLEGGAQTRGRDQRSGGLEDLGSTRSFGVGGSRAECVGGIRGPLRLRFHAGSDPGLP
jgi:hypothetical protein